MEKWLEKLQIMFLGKPWNAQKEEPVKSTPKPAPQQAKIAPRPAQPSTVKTYKVTGMQYRMENLMSLASENPDYSSTKRELIQDGLIGERVWKYDFYAKWAGVVPEPDNPYDPNAIKVVLEGVHVGYIKAGSCAHLLKVLRENRIGRIAFEVAGGPYKWIGEDINEDGKEVYTLERGDVPYYVHLHITELE